VRDCLGVYVRRRSVRTLWLLAALAGGTLKVDPSGALQEEEAAVVEASGQVEEAVVREGETQLPEDGASPASPVVVEPTAVFRLSLEVLSLPTPGLCAVGPLCMGRE
jgi:hypothetical protein